MCGLLTGPEVAVEMAVEQLVQSGGTRVLDLGTGAGCLLLATIHKATETTGNAGLSGLGIDISPKAIEIARQNGEALQLKKKTSFEVGDFGLLGEAPLRPVLTSQGPFDLVHTTEYGDRAVY